MFLMNNFLISVLLSLCLIWQKGECVGDKGEALVKLRER